MIQVTMMRGAQSGGVVTYYPQRGGGLVGVRSRVVNGKRTDLSQLVVNKVCAQSLLLLSSKPLPLQLTFHLRCAK